MKIVCSIEKKIVYDSTQYFYLFYQQLPTAQHISKLDARRSPLSENITDLII